MPYQYVELPATYTYYPNRALKPWVLMAKCDEIHLIKNEIIYHTTNVVSAYAQAKQIDWDFFNTPYLIRLLYKKSVTLEQQGKLYIEGFDFPNYQYSESKIAFGVRVDSYLPNTFVNLVYEPIKQESIGYIGNPFSDYVDKAPPRNSWYFIQDYDSRAF